MWLTTFHLLFAALDPYTRESAWILPTATRILTNFEQADVRVALVVTADEEDTKRFLGPWAKEILTFVDPERKIVTGFGIERLPALVHVGMDGKIANAGEGWNPAEWRRVVDRVAAVTSWTAPVVPGPRDPAPFEGTPAA